MPDKEIEKPPNAAEEPDRRCFIKGAACAIGGVASLVPMAAAVRVVLDPLGREREKSSGGFTRLCAASDLKPGQPTLFKIMADKSDKWSRYRDIPIGAVWVMKAAAGSKISIYSTVCPHLGCFVNFREKEKDFYCPCHNSQFKLDGTAMNKTPPRDMDKLRLNEEKLKADGEVWVKYERFKTNTADRVPA